MNYMYYFWKIHCKSGVIYRLSLSKFVYEHRLSITSAPSGGYKFASSYQSQKKARTAADKKIITAVARAINKSRYKGSVIIQTNEGRNSVTECLVEKRSVLDYIIVSQRKNDIGKTVASHKDQNIQEADYEQNIELKADMPVTYLQWVIENNWESYSYRVNSLFRDNASERNVEVFLIASAPITQSIVRMSSYRPDKSQSGSQRYSSCSILCSLAFNTKILMQIPLSSLGKEGAIQPGKHSFVETTIQRYPIQVHSAYLLHLRVKKDFMRYFNPSLTKRFRIFLGNMRRNIPIITVIDDLIEDSGLKLIDMGFTYNDTAKDLSPKEYLKIFQEMRKWDNYEHSQMKHLMEDKFDDAELK